MFIERSSGNSLQVNVRTGKIVTGVFYARGDSIADTKSPNFRGRPSNQTGSATEERDNAASGF